MAFHNFLCTAGWIHRGLMFCILLATSLRAPAQFIEASARVRITWHQYDAQNRLHVQYRGETNNYHVLLSGDAINRISVPVAVALGTNDLRESIAASGAPRITRFFRITAFSRLQPADTDADGLDDVYELGHGLEPLNAKDAEEDPDKNGLTRLDEYLLNGGPATRVETTWPAAGESSVSVNREVVLRLTHPLAINSLLTRSNLVAEATGRPLLSRIELGPDRRTLTLFPLEPYPSSARIRVRFDARGLKDYLGRPLATDANFANHVLAFDTVPLTPIPGTVVIGQVLSRIYSVEKVATAGKRLIKCMFNAKRFIRWRSPNGDGIY